MSSFTLLILDFTLGSPGLTSEGPGTPMVIDPTLLHASAIG